jgi:ferric iron reductase protein FhuF
MIMHHEGVRAISPIVSMYRELQAIHPKWHVEIGKPSGVGWIAGADFRTALEGPFKLLLQRLGERLHTTDRRTIAASFALRYGWSAGIAIAPYLVHRCVPNIALENVSLKFSEHTLFEKAAVHQPEGVMLQRPGAEPHPYLQWLPHQQELLSWLRESLARQANPIVEALHQWSHFSIRGIWGMITSSWGCQFMNICGEVSEQRNGWPDAQQFFAGDDLIAQMKPAFYPVTHHDLTYVFHRRSSCCRYYLLDKRQYCASCPLLSQEERLRRHTAWMKKLLEPHA